MTPFSAICQLAGLSHREASNILTVRIDTVKSWSNGRNRAPESILGELRSLISQQITTADEVVAMMDRTISDRGRPDTIHIGYPADDHEAQTLGWPCVGAYRAMIARVIYMSQNEIRLVPRGSTITTAAAADAHQK